MKHGFHPHTSYRKIRNQPFEAVVLLIAGLISSRLVSVSMFQAAADGQHYGAITLIKVKRRLSANINVFPDSQSAGYAL